MDCSSDAQPTDPFNANPTTQTLVRACGVIGATNDHVRVGHQLPDSVEVTAYYLVAEALTNVAKHAHGV
jgi:signal transduction histidine kinase